MIRLPHVMERTGKQQKEAVVIDLDTAPRPALVAALRAVLELHAGLPYDHGTDPFGHSRVGATCLECAEEHPCPTVRAIEEALS